MENFATCTQQIDGYLSRYEPKHATSKQALFLFREAIRVGFDGSSKSKSGMNVLNLHRNKFRSYLNLGKHTVDRMIDRFVSWGVLVEDESLRTGKRDNKKYKVNLAAFKNLVNKGLWIYTPVDNSSKKISPEEKVGDQKVGDQKVGGLIHSLRDKDLIHSKDKKNSIEPKPAREKSLMNILKDLVRVRDENAKLKFEKQTYEKAKAQRNEQVLHGYRQSEEQSKLFDQVKKFIKCLQDGTIQPSTESGQLMYDMLVALEGDNAIYAKEHKWFKDYVNLATYGQ